MDKDLEMGRVYWIIWVVPKYNHVYPYKGEMEGDDLKDDTEGSLAVE